MKDVLVAAMPGETAPAQRLAAALNVPFVDINAHHFPDGESLLRAPEAAETTILYNSLNRPNEKLVELGLAVSALHDLGAARIILVAPYLCYMRQDKAFHKGEAVSQRFVGDLLATWFDYIVTIEPHLHRTMSLSEVFPNTETAALDAAPLLAELIQRDGDVNDLLIVGPDRESRPLIESAAMQIGAQFMTLAKTRSGDKKVSVEIEDNVQVSGRRVYIVDDVASTGQTLSVAARMLAAKGAVSIEAVVAHALFSDADLDLMRAAGIARVRSTDSVAHPSNAIEVASLLAGALSREVAS